MTHPGWHHVEGHHHVTHFRNPQDVLGLLNASFESLCPKVFMEHAKNVSTFKIRDLLGQSVQA